ncbi:hypothetical protein [Salinispora mooreana]|uniref:hypothetical protein n=1 Tax=Salinispora mooreana TaxID=999545 RepID=UPI000363586A|nr:hypothetical protein [Salinispora mooreana]
MPALTWPEQLSSSGRPRQRNWTCGAGAAAAVWGEQHRTVAQPSAGWLAELIAEPLAGCPMIAPVVISVASLS